MVGVPVRRDDGVEPSRRRARPHEGEHVVGRVGGVDEELGTGASARDEVDVVGERPDGELADLDLVEPSQVVRAVHGDLSGVRHAPSVPSARGGQRAATPAAVTRVTAESPDVVRSCAFAR